jgi:MFS transporter, DHA2 family, multidrug resistance protein
MIAFAVFGWIATIVWELYVKDPIIDFSLLKSRNFAITTTLLFVFGISLFGTTNLIPQMLQELYGYRAIDAGLVLGPGAFVITLLAPVSAQLLQRKMVSPKVLLFASMSIVGFAMFVYSWNESGHECIALSLGANAAGDGIRNFPCAGQHQYHSEPGGLTDPSTSSTV